MRILVTNDDGITAPGLALAEEIAATLLGRFPMPDISVRIRKPSALAHLGVAAAGVEIHRRALDTEV